MQQLAASLVASSSCQAQQPQLQQQAAALNMQLSSSWQHTAVAGLGTGIDAPNDQAAAAVRHAFCVVQEDEELSPPVLLALSVGRPLVTPAWVEAATTRKAWVEELPPVGQHRPGRLMVPAGVQPGPEGQGPSWLNLADWQGASPGLLSAFLLVFDQRDTVRVGLGCRVPTGLGWVGVGQGYCCGQSGFLPFSDAVGPPRLYKGFGACSTACTGAGTVHLQCTPMHAARPRW